MFAIAQGAVREALALGPVTPVPGAPGGLVGVANVRGEVVPVLDIPGALDQQPEMPQEGDEALLVQVQDHVLLLAAGHVLDLVTLEEPPPGEDPTPDEGGQGPVLRSVPLPDGPRVELLDLERLLHAVWARLEEVSDELQVNPFSAAPGPVPVKGGER